MVILWAHTPPPHTPSISNMCFYYFKIKFSFHRLKIAIIMFIYGMFFLFLSIFFFLYKYNPPELFVNKITTSLYIVSVSPSNESINLFITWIKCTSKVYFQYKKKWRKDIDIMLYAYYYYDLRKFFLNVTSSIMWEFLHKDSFSLLCRRV